MGKACPLLQPADANTNHYRSNWAEASADTQNSKRISEPHPDIPLTDQVAVAWGSSQTGIIPPNSLPTHPFTAATLQDKCLAVSAEAGKSSVTTQPEPALLASTGLPAGDMLPSWAPAGEPRGCVPADERGRHPVSSRWPCPCHSLGFPLCSPSSFRLLHPASHMPRLIHSSPCLEPPSHPRLSFLCNDLS